MPKLNLDNLFSTTLEPSSLQENLGVEFSLCEHGSMVFHWTDFHETCDSIRATLEADPVLREEFERKEKILNRLTLIPVWIQTRQKVYQTTMHALYERHILGKTGMLDGMDFFGPMDVSLISGTGPFKQMAVTEFFNKDVYQDFIMVNLISGKLPKRGFRIRLKSKVLMEYGPQFESAGLVQLEQLTRDGLLLALDSDFYDGQVARSPEVRILLDTKMLGEATGKDLAGLQSHLSGHVFNLLYTSRKEDAIAVDLSTSAAKPSFEFLRTHKKYIFVPYNRLNAADPEAVARLIAFVDYSRELVRQHYVPAKNLKAA